MIEYFDGKREYVRPLGTSELTVAKARVAHVCERAFRTFTLIRNVMLPEDIRFKIAREFYYESLRKDELLRLNSRRSAEGAELLELDQALRDLHTSDLRTESAGGDIEGIRHVTCAMVERHQLDLAPDSDDFRMLSMALMRAQAEVLKRQKERDGGDFLGRHSDPILDPPTARGGPPAPPAITATPSAAVSQDSESARKLFEQFVRENPNRVSNDTLAQSKKGFDLFLESLPRADYPASRISKKEIRDWKSLLGQYPVRAADTNAFRGLNIIEVVEKNKTLQKKTLAPQTVNKYLTFIGSYCDWLEVHGWIDRNPVHGMLLNVNKEEQQGAPFMIEQLKQLFSSPLYVGCASERGWHRSGSMLFSDYRYWVPMIALFSGMRLGEIAQLDAKCVREEDGVLLFDVNRDNGKTVKTANSVRIVPVHEKLIELGLQSFVGKKRKGGPEPLFPELARNARGQVAGDYSRDFNRFLGKVGISGVSFHSFRHGVADALRRAGYLDNQIALILGHTREQTTSSRYGAIAPGTIKLRKEMVDSIKYEGVDLPRSG